MLIVPLKRVLAPGKASTGRCSNVLCPCRRWRLLASRYPGSGPHGAIVDFPGIVELDDMSTFRLDGKEAVLFFDFLGK